MVVGGWWWGCVRFQAIEASRIEGRLATWTPEFTSLEILYKHRFAPFELVEFPEYVSYAQYAARTDMEKAQISVSGTLA